MPATTSTATSLPLRPWRGLAEVTLRLAVYAVGAGLALSAFSRGDYVRYAVLALGSGVWFAGVMSLTHGALHGRLTGRPWLDAAIARLISWPIAWPIGLYTLVHHRDHDWTGPPLDDPGRIQPTRGEYARASTLGRWYFRNQIWFDIVVSGASGLLQRLLHDVRTRAVTLPGVGRAAAIDVAGILACNAAMVAALWRSGGWELVLGGVGVWYAAERGIGFVHQTRFTAEHYRSWRYADARDFRVPPLVGWFLAHLNLHATHHHHRQVAPFALPEAAAALVREGRAPHGGPHALGYLGEVLAAHRLARRADFLPDDLETAA